MSFLRHEEIYRSDVRLGQTWERQPVSSLPVLIGCDEFPVGYSLAGCPPAEPASASPTGTILNNPHCRTMIFQRTATTPFTSCLTFGVHSNSAASSTHLHLLRQPPKPAPPALAPTREAPQFPLPAWWRGAPSPSGHRAGFEWQVPACWKTRNTALSVLRPQFPRRSIPRPPRPPDRG